MGESQFLAIYGFAEGADARCFARVWLKGPQTMTSDDFGATVAVPAESGVILGLLEFESDSGTALIPFGIAAEDAE